MSFASADHKVFLLALKEKMDHILKSDFFYYIYIFSIFLFSLPTPLEQLRLLTGDGVFKKMETYSEENCKFLFLESGTFVWNIVNFKRIFSISNVCTYEFEVK